MSPPDFLLPHPHSPLCSCKDCLSIVATPSSPSPFGNSFYKKVADVSHSQHTLRPIIEAQGAVSPDSDSEGEVTSKLKSFVERQVGTTKAGNRDTIDSILSKYSYESEAEQSDSKLRTETEAGTKPCSNIPKHCSTTAVNDPEQGLELILALKVGTAQESQLERPQALQCPHCCENFNSTYSGNTLRATGLEHDETVSTIALSIADRTDNTFESSDALKAFDSSGFVAEDTTLSSFDHGTISPSDTEINDASDYSLHTIKHNMEKEGYKPTANTRIQNEVSTRGSMSSSEVSDPHTPRCEDDDVEDTLENHWAFLKETLLTQALPREDTEIELGNVDKEVGGDDCDQIGMVLCNLEDAQNRMDNLLAKYPPPSSVPMNEYISAQILANTVAVAELADENSTAVNNDDAGKKQLGSSEKPADSKKIQDEDTTLTKREVQEVADPVESCMPKTGKYKAPKHAAVGFKEALDGDLGGELLLTGAICTMCSLAFAVGAMSI